MVKLISFADSIEASKAFLPFFHQAHRVLEKHDGVIDQEPDGQRQRHQRKVVEAVAEKVHEDERQQQRERQGDRRNQGVGAAAEEDEDDHDHEDKSEVERGLDVVDAGDDGLRAIVGREQQNRTGKLRLNRWQQVAHRLGHLHRIHARPAKHADENVRAGLTDSRAPRQRMSMRSSCTPSLVLATSFR